MAKRGKRRQYGSIGSLKGALWAAVCYNLDVLEDPRLDHDLKQRASNSLTQAALAYLKIIKAYDLEREVQAMEALTPPHGRVA